MAVDTLDYVVLVALAVAIVAYFNKDKFFGSSSANQAGFVVGAHSGNLRNIVDVLAKTNKKCVIFYGSQTGTAEDYLHKLGKELKSRFGLQNMVADLGDYDFDNLSDVPLDTLFFFLLATYGEGEPTDDAVEFFEWLENEAESIPINYSVFGLGNLTYEFYNSIGKKANSSIENLGGTRFADYGEGDDGVGTMDEDFLAWKDVVFESLKQNLNFEEHDLQYEPSFELLDKIDLTANDSQVSSGEPNGNYVALQAGETINTGPFDHTNPYLAPITLSKELFNSKDRNCVHAEFDISDSNLRYLTGDHLAIWPSNSNQSIIKFFEAFDLTSKKDVVFLLKLLDLTIALPFPTPITYEAVVRHHLEITGPVSRQFLLLIALFAPDDASKKRVQEVASDKKLFAETINLKYFNIADALLSLSNGIPWTDVPFVFLIELIAHLQPRYYSISSSLGSEKRSIHVTAVVELEKHGEILTSGVVTNLLRNIEVVQNKKTNAIQPITYDLQGPRKKFSGFKLPVHVRRLTFKLPSNPGVPVILIGPGTGVAPFRGFVRERVQQASNDPNATIGKTLLFYGCRNPDEDFLYKEEWPEYAKKLGTSFELVTAFLRVNAGKKVYVQDRLLEKAKEINDLLLQGAFIYVCGDALRMARDVQKALGQIISDQRNLPSERGAELVRSLKVQNKYQEDVW